MRRPNILLIVTHDSGRQFGCCGAGVETPNIDRLAADGALFANNFCTAPQCSPARASLLTGRYPHRTGLLGLTHRGFRMDPAVPRLPKRLADAGYHTLLFGVHHEEPDPRLMGYALHRTGPTNRKTGRPDRSARVITGLVESFLASKPAEPFFACAGFFETHRPFPMGWPNDDPRSVTVPGWLEDCPEVRGDLAELHGMVRGVDESVGRIDAALHQAALADDTLLIYTTDHGIAFPHAKGTLHDAGLGVVLAARGPGGFDGGKRIERLTSTMDLTPTLLGLAGVEPPGDLDGADLRPLLGRANAPWRDHLFAEQTWHASYDPMRSVRTERFRYIRGFADRPVMFAPNTDEGPTKRLLMQRDRLHKQPRSAEMLYDLADDPFEQRNLAEDPAHAETLADLRGRVQSWMERTNDPLLAGALPLPLPDGAIATPAGAIDPDQFDAPADWR